MVIRSLTAIISARLLPIDDNNHFTSKNVVLRRAAKSIQPVLRQWQRQRGQPQRPPQQRVQGRRVRVVLKAPPRTSPNQRSLTEGK